MTTAVSPPPRLRFADNNGNPLAGGLLFTYAAGTATKLATFTDSTGATPNKNPIVLDSRGECDCWMTSGVGYKFVLSPSTDLDPPANPFWTVDNLVSFAATGTLATLGGNNTFTGNNTFQTGTLTINSVATFGADPVITSALAGPALEPSPILFHNQPSPTNADVAGQISFQANNVRPTQKEYANIRTVANNVTIGGEGGALTFNATVGGVSTQVAIAGAVTAGATGSGGFQLQGTQNKDNATAGWVGEYLTAMVPGGAPLGLANGTPKMVTSLALTAGDWDVWGGPQFTGGITTSVAALIGAISTTVSSFANLDVTQRSDQALPNYSPFGNDSVLSLPVGPFRLVLAGSTPVFLNVQSTFTVSTCACAGAIQARRRR